MRAGVIGCPPDTPLETVARMMAGNHVHSIVVSNAGATDDRRPWGIVSDIDLVRSAPDTSDRTAADVCASEVVTVTPDEPLARAAQLMGEHETSHLIVVDEQSGEPLGVVSSLDVAGIVAWGRG
jgi:CBS domain-containing protein